MDERIKIACIYFERIMKMIIARFSAALFVLLD